MPVIIDHIGCSRPNSNAMNSAPHTDTLSLIAAFTAVLLVSKYVSISDIFIIGSQSHDVMAELKKAR
ncbi:hypothetical protein ABW08_11695 [Pluralibacter gergoviae]|nr:hypothetical protein ABW08_11695 [Pluralibacter gergoviae]